MGDVKRYTTCLRTMGQYPLASMSIQGNGPYVLHADYLALRAECEGLRADAERYRWLRDAKPNALHLSRNGDHACNYMTASAWIDESEEWFAETPPEEIQRMRDTDTIWELQIYPDTPIGSYTYYASTLDAAIDAGRE